MSKIVSTRINDEDLKELREIAETEHMDRATLIRKFLVDQIVLYRMRKQAELYRKGHVSLQEAATTAKVSIYEMMDFVEKEKIFPPPETDEQLREDLSRTRDLLDGKRKK